MNPLITTGVSAAHWSLEPAHHIPVPESEAHLICVALSPARRHALWIDGSGAGEGSAAPGSVRVVPAGARGSVEVDASPRADGHFEFFHFYVPPNAFAEAKLGLDVENPHLVNLEQPGAGEVDAVLEGLARALVDSMDGAGRLEALYREYAVMTALTHIARRYGRLSDRAAVPGGLARWRLRQVIDYIDAHLAEDISLSHLAEVTGLSERHFCTAFGRSLGLPPHRYVIGRRVERAKELLVRERHLSVVEIALACGFGSSAHFASTFRAHTGTTPTRFRTEAL